MQHRRGVAVAKATKGQTTMKKWNVVLTLSAEVEALDADEAYDLALAELVEGYDDGNIGDPRDMAYTVEQVQS